MASKTTPDALRRSVNSSVSAVNAQKTEAVQKVMRNLRRTPPEKSQDDANVITPESNVRMQPFDICKAKITTSVVLKKSLFEINRAKRKEAESRRTDPSCLHLNPGMILLKNFIRENDQVKIVEKCRNLGLGPGGFYRPGYTDGSKLQLHMMCLGKNWDPESKYENVRRFDGAIPPKIPGDLVMLVSDAMSASYAFLNDKNKDVNELPNMSPDICIVNFYSNHGRLGLHQDKDESFESIKKGLPVVSFSLGDSAEFLYGESRDLDSANKVVLESGDVLIFGGESRLAFHGVSTILPNTAPKWFSEKTNMLPGRLNLTFRQY